MSLRPEISDRAQRDLDRQYRWYLKHASVEVADGFFTAFHSAFDSLLVHPHLGWDRLFRGRKLSGLRSKMLDAPYEKFLIYYRIEPDCVSVERVMHGSRDVPRRLGEEAAVYGMAPQNPAGEPAVQNIS